jgi:hypothetical protein
MRKRIIPAAVVLGLGIVGIALAQQAGQQPENREDVRAKQRAQVARLRAEVELLELEHEADRAALSDELQNERKAERIADDDGKVREIASEMRLAASSVGKLKDFEKEVGDGKTAEAKVQEELRQAVATARSKNGRRKREFVLRTAELNEKRLELADAEKRFTEVK